MVPNSDLYLMKTVKDVIFFYSTPVSGTTSYNQLMREQNKNDLPANLHLLPDAARFDPNGTFLKGLDAFPGAKEGFRTLKEKKMFVPLKKKVQWPDI